MNRVAALAAVIGLFAVGVLIGALAVHIYHADSGSGHGWSPHRSRPAIDIRRLEHELDLSTEQREEVQRILDQARVKADALRADLRPQIHRQMNETHEQLREVLTAEQLERFDRMHRDHRRFAERFLLGHGDHPGAPEGHEPAHP